jgi:TIR domain
MTAAEGGGVFISYRRQETRHLAGRLYDRLADRFGEAQVFIDVVTMEPGVDFAAEISRAVAACQVLLAVIGPGWLTAPGERGTRRLDDPGDIVRLEIKAAIASGVRVIPILVDGAVMPGRQDLPESLADLARRNALLIRHESFPSDAERLVTAIERILAPAAAVAPSGSAPVRNDPDRAARLLADAERIANAITDDSSKERALSRIAEALAATDPDRAARLLNDAERIANSSPDEISKAEALSRIARALAATDPDRAERIANAITIGFWKAEALREIAQALAATSA